MLPTSQNRTLLFYLIAIAVGFIISETVRFGRNDTTFIATRILDPSPSPAPANVVPTTCPIHRQSGHVLPQSNLSFANLPEAKAASKRHFAERLDRIRKVCHTMKHKILEGYHGRESPDHNSCYYSVDYHFRSCVPNKVSIYYQLQFYGK